MFVYFRLLLLFIYFFYFHFCTSFLIRSNKHLSNEHQFLLENANCLHFVCTSHAIHAFMLYIFKFQHTFSQHNTKSNEDWCSLLNVVAFLIDIYWPVVARTIYFLSLTAIAMAISDSVTVSIGDDTNGARTESDLVNGDVKSTSSAVKSM